ncbi:hypothetical protein ABIE32_003740 [Comamonas sp. 4034]
MREAMHHQKYDLPSEPTFPPLEENACGKSGDPTVPSHHLLA